MSLIPADVSQLLAFSAFARSTGRKIRTQVVREVAKTTEQVADEARERAPKLTGALAASITGNARGLKGLVEAGVDYAHWPEWGYGHGPPQPYMNPAADTADGTFPDAVESAVIGAIGL